MEAFFNTMSVPAKFLLAFIVVLAVLGIGGYLMRRLTGGTLSIAGPRGRQPRLAVIDAASVDGRRRLVLVRRDNVEHLLLIGGPTDIVVEPNIDKAALAASAAVPASLRDLATSPARETLARPSPAYEAPLARIVPAIAREPMSREPLHREPLQREPLHREPMYREAASRPAATYEPVRQAPAFEPAPVLEETHWPAPEPVAMAPVEPSHTSWPAPEPVAAAPVEQPHTPWLEPAALAPVEPTWPAPEPVAVAPVRAGTRPPGRRPSPSHRRPSSRRDRCARRLRGRSTKKPSRRR